MEEKKSLCLHERVAYCQWDNRGTYRVSSSSTGSHKPPEYSWNSVPGFTIASHRQPENQKLFVYLTAFWHVVPLTIIESDPSHYHHFQKKCHWRACGCGVEVSQINATLLQRSLPTIAFTESNAGNLTIPLSIGPELWHAAAQDLSKLLGNEVMK
jgi:hypothetical protein